MFDQLTDGELLERMLELLATGTGIVCEAVRSSLGQESPTVNFLGLTESGLAVASGSRAVLGQVTIPAEYRAMMVGMLRAVNK